MAIRMQQRRGTAAQWISLNDGDGPILGAGEIGFESDTGKFKIGDGTNHWIDLDYFLDASELTTSLGGYLEDSLLGAADGIAQLNSSGKLVSTQIPNIDEITQDAINTALTAGTGITKTYDDNANTITVAVDTTAIQARVADVSDTEIGYLNGVTSSIQTQLDNKLASADLTEAAQDAVNTAIIAGTGLDKTYDDASNTITLDIDSTVATKSFAAGLLTNATKSNITITGDADGLTITAENGVADSNTDNLAEGSTNKYFTDERAQDAIGSNVGTGLSYNDTTGAISVDTTAIQARVTNVTDTEIGYLDGVTSAIQTQMDAKAPLASPTFTGTVTLPANTISQSMMGDDSVGTNEIGGLAVTTEKIADGAVTNAKVSASAAIAQSKIDGLTTDLGLKAPLASPTFTGSVTLPGAPSSDLHAATKAYVDAATSGLNVHESVVAATTGNVNLTNAVDNNKTLDGVTLSTGDRILVKNQSTASDNGIYIVASNGAPTRASDYNTAGEVDAGDFIFVSGGTVNDNTGWIQTETITTVGTDSILFTQFSGAGTYTASTGLTLTGTAFSANIGTDIQAYNSTLAAVAAGTYTGDDSITTLGTITSGTWTGTTIAIANGGTGATTASTAAAALLPVQTSNSGKYLTTDGSGTLSWGTVSGYSAPTLGSTSIASGATVTTIAGLTLTAPVATTSLTLNATAELRLADTDSTHYVGFKSPSTVSTNKIWTLPSADGTAGQVLSTNGSATLSWATAGGGGADEVKLVMGAY